MHCGIMWPVGIPALERPPVNNPWCCPPYDMWIICIWCQGCARGLGKSLPSMFTNLSISLVLMLWNRQVIDIHLSLRSWLPQPTTPWRAPWGGWPTTIGTKDYHRFGAVSGSPFMSHMAWDHFPEHIETGKKWLPFHRQHFQMHFHEWKLMNFT